MPAAGSKWLRSFLKKASNFIYENSWRHFCSSGGRLYIRKRSKVFFDNYESELRKVNHQAHRTFNVNGTGITAVQHRQ
jgi:hypothetical protein